MAEVWANRFQTTLKLNLVSSATTVEVEDASGSPTLSGSDYFYAAIEVDGNPWSFEIVKCTALSGNTFTVQRGFDGTTAKEWGAGTLFRGCTCAQTYRDAGGPSGSDPYPQYAFTDGTKAFNRLKLVGTGGNGMIADTDDWLLQANNLTAGKGLWVNGDSHGTSKQYGIEEQFGRLRFKAIGTRMEIDGATGNVGIGATPSANALLSLGSSVLPEKFLIYENGTSRYGFGIASNELRRFVPSPAGRHSFGQMSSSGVYSELMRLDNTGSLGIGSIPNSASAILDLASLTRGFLPPRMNTTQRNAVPVANGLVIFNTTTGVLNVYNALTAQWEAPNMVAA